MIHKISEQNTKNQINNKQLNSFKMFQKNFLLNIKTIFLYSIVRSSYMEDFLIIVKKVRYHCKESFFIIVKKLSIIVKESFLIIVKKISLL